MVEYRKKGRSAGGREKQGIEKKLKEHLSKVLEEAENRRARKKEKG
jgi:hypothetical protein